jgi:hypothetical protein
VFAASQIYASRPLLGRDTYAAATLRLSLRAITAAVVISRPSVLSMLMSPFVRGRGFVVTFAIRLPQMHL